MAIINISGKNYGINESISTESYTCVIYSGYRSSSAMLSKLPGRILQIEPNPEWWYFNRLFVHPDHRKCGVGTFLLEKAKLFASERGIAIYCDVNPYGKLNLEETVEFYEKRGFKRRGRGAVCYMPQEVK